MPSASAPSRIALQARPEGTIQLCGAKTKSRAGTCRQTAGARTDHVGYGHCWLHGGATPTGEMFAAKLEAAALALEYQVEPHEALLRAVGQAARWELICRIRVADLQEHELAVPHVRKRVWNGTSQATDTQGGGEETIEEAHADLNVWVKAHIGAVRDLAGIAKTAIDAGVEERRVRVVEQLGDELAQTIGAIYQAIEPHLDEPGRTLFRETTRVQLLALEGGAGG